MHLERFRPPVTLTGVHVDLVPLERSHTAALLHAARDPEVQRFLLHPLGGSRSSVEAVLDQILREQAAGTDLAFTTRLRSTGEIVGMTRFLRIDPPNDSVEIGGTFLDSRYWRTPLNTDSKLAMLRYAFEVASVHRVALQTDLRNERSQAAIARLGAVREGVRREDRRLPNGTFRSSVLFSLLESEWPAARDRLELALRREWSPRASGTSPR